MALTDKQNNEVTVTNNEARSRYEIAYPGEGKPAGFAEYVSRNGERLFIHTEVSDDYQGRGLAGILVGEALKDTLPTGETVVGVCPYVAKFIEKNGYDGPHRPATREDIP